MSILSINRNLSAGNVANTLTSHYGNLATSTQRLSSGLRINSAADDAAGLAIRELQRADIAALHQGTRNANDAISMLQTFDGALGVIDEKLIRLKELAEQAATGTYDSTQRLMIDSEFQAMTSEINRIARATDFNGIKLLDGEGLNGAAGHAGGVMALASANKTGVTGPDGKIYDITLDDTVVNAQLNAQLNPPDGGWDLSGITNPAALPASVTISNNGAILFGDQYLLVTPNNFPSVPAGVELTLGFNPSPTTGTMWSISAKAADGTALGVTINSDAAGICMFSMDDPAGGPPQAYVINVFDVTTGQGSTVNKVVAPQTWTAPNNDHSFTTTVGTFENIQYINNQLSMTLDLGNGNKISNTWQVTGGTALAMTGATLNFAVQDVTPGGTNPPGPGPNPPSGPDGPGIPDLFTDKVKIHFGTMNDSAEDYYYINKHDATTRGLGLEDVDIQTQQKAQEALVKVNDAIVKKDKIRAEFGAMQNRLENTVTNLTIQAENLQASESRISDADIAKEMTTFVRNQILTQSAVAMLGQANAMPQMVMSLIGG